MRPSNKAQEPFSLDERVQIKAQRSDRYIGESNWNLISTLARAYLFLQSIWRENMKSFDEY
jgi:hypothetical protein